MTENQLAQETLSWPENTVQLPWFHIVPLQTRRESRASFTECKDITEEATS